MAESNASREPRFVRASRRRFLSNTAVGGIVIGLGGLAACGNNDADAFDVAADETTSSSQAPASSTTTTTESTTTSTASETTTVAPEEGAQATGELLVSFSYTSDGSGKRENPYIAVWVETPDGELVDTIALWFEQSKKGDKWIDDLRSWYNTSDRAADVTMSSATRAAGSYTVAWDLTDIDGNPIVPTELVLFVESSREKGPHHITSTSISVADRSAGALEADGELHDLSISWA